MTVFWRTCAGLSATACALIFVAVGSANDMSQRARFAQTLVVGTGSTTFDNSEQSFPLLYEAAQKGYFAQQGLDVQIKPFGSTVGAALVAGQADLLYAAPTTAFSLIQGGEPARIIYNGVGGGFTGAVISAKADITKITQCKTLITGFTGSAAYAWAVEYKKLFGLSWTVTPSANTAVIAPAVAAGNVDCALLSFGALNPLVAANQAHYVFNPLVKKGQPKGFPSAAGEITVFGLKAHLDELGKATLVKFLRALNKARNDFRTLGATDLATIVQAYPGGTPITTPAATALNMTIQKPLTAPTKGFITPGIWDTMRRFYRAGGFGYMSATNSTYKYQNVVDMSYLRAAGVAPPKKKKK